MRHAPVEHVEQHLAAEPVGGGGPGGGGHGRGDGGGGVGAPGHDGAQVAVGEDADAPVVERDDQRGRAALRHPPGRLADRGGGRGGAERCAQQLTDRALGGVGAGVAAASPAAEQRGGEQRAGDVAQAGGAAEQVPHPFGGQAQAGGGAVRDGGEPDRQPGQHRGVPEQLARPELVEHPPREHDLHGSGAHHAHVRGRPGAFGQDHGAGGVLLGDGDGGQPAELVRAEPVERRHGGEEAGDRRIRDPSRTRAAHVPLPPITPQAGASA